jgi:hypothetical protein
MITIESMLYNERQRIGYRGHGSAICPYCNHFTDIGTGEHGIPDVAQCGCGNWFRYWPSGSTQRVNAQRQAELNKELNG